MNFGTDVSLDQAAQISLDELVELEIEDAAPVAQVPPDETLTAIFKVTRPRYVPEQVNLRARIDDEVFTGSFSAGCLSALHKDKKIASVEIARPMKVIE
jgi:hypothetical protein